jgi:hypothetical protein
MGLFPFEHPADVSDDWRAAMAGAWLVNGYDHWPIPSERGESDRGFTLERKGKESAMLSLVAPVPSGPRTISTSTLRSTEKPYRTLLELARGSLNRLRNLADAMASAEIRLPEELELRIRACTAAFGKAVSGEPGEQPGLGASAIDDALSTADAVMNHLAEQRLRERLEDSPGLETRFGGVVRAPLGDQETEAYRSIFNSVRIAPSWRVVEAHESHFDWSHLDRTVDWALSNRLSVTLGPVVDFRAGSMPSWLEQQHDLPLLAAFMDDFLGTVVARYGGKVDSFQVFSGLNSRDEFGLVEDDRLRLAARLLESAAQIDPARKWSYLLREPFGDYLRLGHDHYSPLVFADTLIRSGHETPSVGLDLDSGDPHDALDLLPMIDHFSSVVSKLDLEMGGNRNDRSPAFTASLVRTALSSEGVVSLTWCGWSREQSPDAAASSLIYDGGLTTLGREFQILRTRWWRPHAAES